MNSGKRNTARKVICLVLAVLILGSLVSGALIMTVGAASSKEIEKELIALREEQAELKKQSDALQSSIKDNQAKTQTLVEKKADIDQQMEMSRQSIENLNEQIQQYSLLIAQKQDELEQTEAEEARLNEQYKTRLRSMEETGKISYWSILFGASSFSDLLDKVNMINEIAESDKLMLEKMADVAAQIATERAELETQMDDLEQAKSDLAEQQTALEAQRAESDQLILQMAAEYDSMSEEYQNYEKLEDEMSAQIKKTETDYFNALSKEEAARQAELNRQNNNKVPSNSGSSGSGNSGSGNSGSGSNSGNSSQSGGNGNGQGSAATPDDVILWGISSRYIDESELYNYSAGQLRLIRNEIFALHGRIFRSQDLRDYFSQKSWYVPTYDPDDFDANMFDYLNDYEAANLKVILNYEAALAGN